MTNRFSEISANISLDDDEFDTIVKIGTPRYCAPGEIIFQLGSTGQEMYILVDGEVELIFEEGKGEKKLHKKSFFGELAFVMGAHQRTATVRATQKTQLAVLDEKTVDRLTTDNPKLLFALLRRTCMYLFRSEQSLIKNLKQKNNHLQKTLDYLRVTKEELDYQSLLAQMDQLTGLYNRRCLDSQLDKFVARADLSNGGLGLLMMDLDGFKPINDTYGHKYGDEVLVKIGDILSHSCRPTDLPCRLGGDEFALLLPDFNSMAGKEIGRKICAKIREITPVTEDLTIKLTISIGGTCYVAGESPESLMERADKYLYKAKRMGGDIVVWEDSP